MILFVLKTLLLFCTLNRFAYVEGFDIHRASARLIDGTDVDIKDFPYYAGLINCGAAILSESWVITAAHCVDHPEWTNVNYIWVGGESFLTSQIVKYDYVVSHERVGIIDPHTTGPVNDIALLHLSEPLEFTDKIQPIVLPPTEDLTRSNIDGNLVVAGRGSDENGFLSKTLQKIDVERLSSEECLSYMPYNIQKQIRPVLGYLEKAIICAKRVNGRPGLCEGDSGSPLTQGNTLIGITSFVGARCDVATLGFYVNIVNYVPWIKSVTGLK